MHTSAHLHKMSLNAKRGVQFGDLETWVPLVHGTTMFDDQTNRQEQHGVSDAEFGVYVRSVGTWARFSLMFRVTMLGEKGGGESEESLLFPMRGNFTSET
jgi:hypothetical protein